MRPPRAAGALLVAGVLAVGGALAVGAPDVLARHGGVSPGELFGGATGGPAPPPVAPAGVAGLDHLEAPLARSMRLAMRAAGADGVELHVTSGWRSKAHQQELYEEAIRKYGSPELARRWVLPPGESAHVRGEAVDVGPPAGAAWLERNGVRFGLCRRYANEPWHFERLAGAKGSVCPAMEPHA